MTKNLKQYSITYCNIKCDSFIDLRTIVISTAAYSRTIKLDYNGDDIVGDLTINNIELLSDKDKNAFAKLAATILYP
jgi:hypothetical protein